MNDDESNIVRKGRKGEFNYSERAGLMHRSKCPDCGGKLTMIKKVIHTDTIDGSAVCGKHAMAAICENKECWRYTNLNSLRWWRKAV